MTKHSTKRRYLEHRTKAAEHRQTRVVARGMIQELVEDHLMPEPVFGRGDATTGAMIGEAA